MPRMRNAVATARSRITTSATGEALPNSSPLPGGGSGFCTGTITVAAPAPPGSIATSSTGSGYAGGEQLVDVAVGIEHVDPTSSVGGIDLSVPSVPGPAAERGRRAGEVDECRVEGGVVDPERPVPRALGRHTVVEVERGVGVQGDRHERACRLADVQTEEAG